MSNTHWWQRASVYQLYVRSFADSNGDGIGDLAGITARLPHIASLGVDAIWLNPCYPSPQIDHGYDVSDYFNIEPAYGDLAAFDALVDAASAHGIRILMDVVPNHCSAQHPWFKAAVAAGPGSPERARFHFLPGKGADGSQPPNNWTAIFGGSVWTRVTEADGSPGEWYLGVFTPDQPDMNWNNPEVVQHFDDMLRFWFDRGVEGFRADAVTVLAKAEGYPDLEEELEQFVANPLFTWVPEGHNAWRHWREVVNAYEAEHPGRDLFIVAEAYTPGRPDLMLDYANPNEFHQAFAFDLMLAPWRTDWLRKIISETIDALSPGGVLPAWTMNNHDAQRSVTRLARADATTRDSLFPGSIINTDVELDLELGARRARAAYLLEMALPGCVYLYAGEELGLPEVLDLPDHLRQDPVFHNTGGKTKGRDGCRIPLPWTADGAGSNGFSPSTATTSSWLPQPSDWGRHGADLQERDPQSFLALYRTAGALRRSLEGLRSGDFAWVDGADDRLLVFDRGDVRVVCNPTAVAIPLPAEIVGTRTVALGSHAEATEPGQVPADSTLWLH
jgi:alpha-glucosidase